MTIRMLIDARHREETRVAVVKGNRIEEFDFESAEHKQLKGNIYLAKVTRVEPSLQAAFVDYGGNRHGFLAFSEIHPDYYQIPKEDRDALLREEAEHAAEEEALRAREDEHDDDSEEDDEEHDAPHDHHDDDQAEDGEGDAARPVSVQNEGSDESAVDRLRSRRMALRRRYKIQDVIRRRQVLLVQVVKEERGNKGAALTTYLSLAGRYCVLMPNTSHGGGISRKISNVADRKRLKSIMSDLALPKTMGCIVRTAGLQRTKVEIKRDFDYLARLWDEIRETTLHSSAPAVVYGDSDLIKRAIRDVYNKDIDEVIVEGEDGYRSARALMKLLMPSHVKKVVAYSDPVPLFQRFGVEDQLAAMYQPLVQLKSGGYLVINPTEALVSIDINSGRSTREHNIEQTALNTNLEAANEIARQLRLRDMAGLVVIDFIDMEHGSNVRKVERAMKEALKNDRARIQVGRISSFGLFEMSRQRLRTGVLEASTRQCPHCEGTGLVRTASSAGLSALRMLEDEAARGRGSKLTLRLSQEAAFYLLNRKRSELAEIEDRFGVSIEILPDGTLEGARMSVEASGPPPAYTPKQLEHAPIAIDDDDDVADIEDDAEEEEEQDGEEQGEPRSAEESEQDRNDPRRRRRRRRRRGRGRDGEAGEAGEARDSAEAAQPEDREEDEGGAPEHIAGESASDAEARRKRSRRGRRGGKRRNGAESEQATIAAESSLEGEAPAAIDAVSLAEPAAETVEAPVAKAKARRRPRAAKADATETVEAVEASVVTENGVEAPKPKATRRRKAEAPAEVADVVEIAAPATEEAVKPKRPRARKAVAEANGTTASFVEAPAEAENQSEPDAEPASPRRGWWQRTFGE
jgi:ribonuclease E